MSDHVNINPDLGPRDAIIIPQSNARPLMRHGCSRLEGFLVKEVGSQETADHLRYPQNRGYIFLVPDTVQVVSGHEERIRWVTDGDSGYWHIVERNGTLA